MAEKIAIKKQKRRKVIFSLFAPAAKTVCLVGDFNGWDEKKHPMKKDAKEIWAKATLLLPGRYEYKFLVDGEWQTDPENDTVCMNRFGTCNNVITVSEKAP